MDVLVFTPVDRLEDRTLAGLAALQWDREISFLLQRDNPGRDGRENVLHQYRRGRETFLAGRYDAMMIVESDLVIPADSLKKLAALQADLAYGLYVFRSYPATVNVLEHYGEGARNHGEPLTAHPTRYARALAAGTVRCSGSGLGCVLVRRHVLERIDFRHEPAGGHCDSYFTGDVYRAGFSMWADLTVECGHVTPEGVELWPPKPEPRKKQKTLSLKSLA